MIQQAILIGKALGYHRLPGWLKRAIKRTLNIKSQRFITISQAGEASALALKLIDFANRQGIAAKLGGSLYYDTARINVYGPDFAAFSEIITEVLRESRNTVIYLNKNKVISSLPIYDPEKLPIPIDLALVRYRGASDVYVSRVEINIWHDMVRFGTKRVSTSRAHSTVSRADSYAQIASLPNLEFQDKPYRSAAKCQFPIDLVFTWVDGGDDRWQERKNEQLILAGRAVVDSKAHADERFKSRNELKYALRSVSMYAPFVRNVFIVTDDQTPEWLNLKNERVKLVPHREIFRHATNLPTFNSHSIESQLHHIDGLSEHFIYSNDDMMFGQIVQPEDFFDPNGLSRIFPDSLHVQPEFVDEKSDDYLQAHKRAIEIFRRDFGVSPTQLMLHVPYAAQRSILYEVEERYSSEWRITASNRFRAPSDVAPLSFFYPHYSRITARSFPSRFSHRYVPLWADSLPRTLETLLERRPVKSFCLNDAGVAPDRVPEVDRLLASFLEAYFPIKSEFEI